jgi:ABC-2 type transport system ATP-binding protein
MEEVEYLCKRIAIIDDGKLIVSGTQRDLSNRLAGGRVLKLTVDSLRPSFIEQLKQLNGVEKVIVQPAEEIDVHLQSEMEIVSDVILLASRSGIAIHNMQLKEANLETLFLQLTGRSLRE